LDFSMLSWSTLTAIGDSKVMLPAAAFILAWLASAGARKAAFWWCALFGAAFVLVVLTKLAFIGWGIGIPALDFTGISGHSMRATAIIPVLVFLIFQQSRPHPQRLAVATGFLLGLLIAMSRVMVDAHSVSEAVAGAVLGTATSAAFLRIAAPMQPLHINRTLVASCVLVLGVLTLTEPAPTKFWLKEAGMYLSGRDQAFTRQDGGRTSVLQPLHPIKQ
jgi:membrane-associated phospholipid phosphatase